MQGFQGLLAHRDRFAIASFQSPQHGSPHDRFGRGQAVAALLVELDRLGVGLLGLIIFPQFGVNDPTRQDQIGMRLQNSWGQGINPVGQHTPMPSVKSGRGDGLYPICRFGVHLRGEKVRDRLAGGALTVEMRGTAV